MQTFVAGEMKTNANEIFQRLAIESTGNEEH